jgi:hypothetical protein
VDEQRRTLWRTSWGVVLAASGAFSLGYAMSRASDPSAGASRPPGWPLFVSLLVVAVSLWFVLAPTLHRWPFETGADRGGQPPEPWLAELTETEDPEHAPIATFTIGGDASPPERPNV